MKEQDLKEFIAKYYSRENESCEWKEFKELKHAVSGKDMDDIISYVSAFSNMNGGTLVVGVKDQKLDIIGIQGFYNYTPENLRFRILDLCTNLPSENFYVDEYVTDDTKKTVWIIHIPKHQPRKAVIAHTKAYMRIGDSLVEMSEERHNKILHELIIDDDWSSKIIPEATIEDLDEEAIYKARREFVKRNPKYADEMRNWDDEKFLNKAKLLIKGKITRAALILLGKEESEFYLNPSVMKIRWLLKTPKGWDLDYEIFSIPMLLAVDAVEAKIRNIRIVEKEAQTMFPDEFMRYDSFTIRESINNCIAHQDYTMGARIEVVEFENEKLVFKNAGTFIPKSINEVLASDSPESVYRNPFLVEAMRNLGMIETQGGGIKKLHILQMRRGFALPKYDFDNMQVKLTIDGIQTNNRILPEKLEELERTDRFDEYAEEYARETVEKMALENVPQNLKSSTKTNKRFDENEKGSMKSSMKIIELMKNDSMITAIEIASKLNISKRAVDKQIQKLREASRIKRVGPDKGGHWEIIGE